jgi:hypothetical protein
VTRNPLPDHSQEHYKAAGARPSLHVGSVGSLDDPRSATRDRWKPLNITLRADTIECQDGATFSATMAAQIVKK